MYVLTQISKELSLSYIRTYEIHSLGPYEIAKSTQREEHHDRQSF